MKQAQYVTEKEVAAMTCRAVSTLRNDRYMRRNIPYVKIGRSVRYKLADVLEFMDGNRIEIGE